VWGGLALFTVACLWFHVTEAELDPSHHQVSEYANTRHGWAMSLGFTGWAVALVALGTQVPATLARQRHLPLVVAGLLVAAAAGLLITALFATDTSAGQIPAGQERTSEGRLHDLGSGLAFVCLFVAATLALALAELGSRWRRPATALLAAAAVTQGVLLIAGDPAPGWRQRVGIVAALGWHAGLALMLSRTRRDCDGSRR
jgi:hypothetical protein